MKKDNKKLPKLSSDQEAEDFVSNSDLTQYDLSQMKPISFEYKRKTKQVNLRISEDLLDEVKAKADQQHMPYQRFIQDAIEQALQN